MIKILNSDVVEKGLTHTIEEFFYTTFFDGCQCSKECTCQEDFISDHGSGFRVQHTKRNGETKTTLHASLEEARERANDFQIKETDQ